MLSPRSSVCGFTQPVDREESPAWILLWCETRHVGDQSPLFVDEPATDPAVLRTLAAAGLPATGRFFPKPGWVNRVWVGDEYVVRLSDGQFRDSFRHEATVASLLAGNEVPHARHLGHGDGPDGLWYVSERLPGRTMHDAWPAA